MFFYLNVRPNKKILKFFTAAGCVQMMPGMNLKKEAALLFAEDEKNCTLYQNESLSEGLF